MTILGLDPGTARVGWGVIKINGTKCESIAYGLIETDKETQAEMRLKEIYSAINTLIKQYKPDVVSIEELFFATNAKTAMAVGQARGVLLLASALNRIKTASYSPLAIKRCITGDGKADKQQVQYMVIKQLHLKEIPKPDDVADALAIALTHAFSYKMKEACI
ncbi:MAG: crossover junction endodeoxyribonuclease RuvC [Candidatus Gottesmanbacteria bacterium]